MKFKNFKMDMCVRYSNCYGGNYIVENNDATGQLLEVICLLVDTEFRSILYVWKHKLSS